MKKEYIKPEIAAVDMAVDTQILAGSQVAVDIVDDDESDYDGAFNSASNIFIWDDEEE